MRLNDFKYILFGILIFPLLPIMLWQAIQIRKRVPKLPEATGNKGNVASNSTLERHLLFLGESTIAGVGVATHEEGFAGAFSQYLAKATNSNIHWEVRAKSGYTAKVLRERIVQALPEQSVDAIIIGLGANNAFSLHSPWRWRKEISKLLTALGQKFPHQTIFFTNIPPIKSFPAFTPLIKLVIGNLGEMFGEELDYLLKNHPNTFFYAQKITLEDWVDRLGIDEATPEDFFSDGVHPSKLTYQTWAKDCVRFIQVEKIQL